MGCGDVDVRSHVLALPALRHSQLQRGPLSLGVGLALILTITFLSPVLFDILARV